MIIYPDLDPPDRNFPEPPGFLQNFAHKYSPVWTTSSRDLCLCLVAATQEMYLNITTWLAVSLSSKY